MSIFCLIQYWIDQLSQSDALMGFRELFENYPELVESSLTPFVAASVRIIADEVRDSNAIDMSYMVNLSVRMPAFERHCSCSLAGFSLEFHMYAPLSTKSPSHSSQVQETLVPHSPLLLLFTTSAQTHIFPEIRIDAIRFLDLFLDLIPEVVVSGWKDGKGGHGRRVLEGYLGILNAGTTFGEGAGADPYVQDIPQSCTIFR